MSTLRLALRFARRDVRGGLKGFRLLVACLALGVAAIAAAGSLRAAFETALSEQSRTLIGGDLAFAQPAQPPTPEQVALLSSVGAVTAGIEMRGMASLDNNRDRTLVEVKGVDEAYPLVGQVDLSPAQPLAEALALRDGHWGAVADPNLLTRLGLVPGDRLHLGDAELEVRAILVREPDRIANAMGFGPRLMVADEALGETGLIRPGSLIRHTLRVALFPGNDPADLRRHLAERFPDAPWQIRDTAEPAPGLGRFLDTVAAFMTLVGLTALLVGGIGIANAVRAYLDSRTDTIATLKCLGAPVRLILLTYLLLVGLMALIGIVIGLAAGAALVPLAIAFAGESLPLPAKAGLFPVPLIVAAGFGVLSALVFTLAPLGRARRIPAALLFRQRIAPDGASTSLWSDRPTLLALGLASVGLAALTVLSSGSKPLAAGFVVIAIAVLALFRALAWALSHIAAKLTQHHGRLIGPGWRMALSNLHRPGSAVVGMVLSLGLGLSVLVTIALVEGNLADQFGRRLPRIAPSYFFIDVQPDQVEPLRQTVAAADPTATLETAPMVRGRLTAIKGIPVEAAHIAPDVAWAARGDRGLSTAIVPPPGTRLVAGTWWPSDYNGPPLVSVDRAVAKGFGLSVGDRVGLNVLGREIEAEVASLRDIDWSSLSMNFAFLVSPGALTGAPYTVIATLRGGGGDGLAVEKAVTDRLPNISAIRVKEALDTARGVIDQADLAVRAAAAVTLAAGAMVLAGAVMAGHRRRVWESVVLKVLGASRAQIRRAYLIEFGLIGLGTGLAAALVAQGASWALLTQVMKTGWVFLPGLTLGTLAGCLVAALIAGYVGTWQALRVKAAPLLREE